jgi:solute carrier family 30 (zinc transporter), member 2
LVKINYQVAEVIGGYFAGSLAVMTDAAHLMSDFVGFLVSLFALWVAKWPPNKHLQFGYHRAGKYFILNRYSVANIWSALNEIEILGALSSIFIIWILTGVFVYLAVLRVINQDFVIEPDTMMIVAALGIIINIL